MQRSFVRISFLACFLFISMASGAQWVQKAYAKKKRSEVSSVVYNGKLYTFLGFSDSLLNVEPSVEVYDPAQNTWTLLRSLALDKTVTHQGVALIDDKVWHIGGRVGKNPGKLTSEIWIYNITTNAWMQGPQLKDPATGQPLLWGGGGAALLGRTLHLFGGFTINACNNDQDEYHLTLDVDSWLANPSAAPQWKNNRAPLPTKRNHFSTVVLGGKIYALGGQFGHDCGGGQDKQYAHVYNPVTNVWTQLPLLLAPRSHMEGSTFAMDGKIYIVAGQGTSGANTNKVTIFDPAGNNGVGTWKDDTNLALPKKYEGLSSKVIGTTFIFSHGGEGSSRKTRNTTYSRTITRTPVYKFGFSSGCSNLKILEGASAKTKTLLFTIDGTKTYAISSNAKWLTISKNATGTAVPNAVDIELTANTAGLAPGTYSAVITATGTGSGTAYTAASYCINLTVQAKVPEISTTPEVVLSGVKGTVSAAEPVVIYNSGTAPLQITALSISGTHAAAFTLKNTPTLPYSIPAGKRDTLNVAFTPPTTLVGALNALLTISNNDANEKQVTVGLYGLSATGEQGSKEPPLNGVVKTLGYAINVGGTGLILSTGAAAIGDEVLEPLFRKAGTGAVTMKAVARYSPDDLLAYGYYTKNSGTPVLNELGKIALNQEQTLLPALTTGSKTSFDPGTATFGFYTGATSYAGQNTYTEDKLNTGPLPHSARIYPLKNRAGVVLPNSYLVAFEPASNGDYQDYVFEVTNVMPATSAPIRINTGSAATTVNGVNWLGCAATGSCASYVSGGGFAYAQSSVPAISGMTTPTSQAIMQTEWTGGASGGSPVAVGQVAFTYTIPVTNGKYTVRLHFVELNKNGTGLRKFDVNIEGGDKELTNFDIFAAAGGLYKAIYRDFPVSITDGNIKIEFYRQVENAKISAIEILPPAAVKVESGFLEAEQATLYKAIATSNWPGYTGTGFADYVNSVNDYVEWTAAKATAGPVSFQIRYANGGTSSRPLKFEVNGVTVLSTLAFPPTGGWEKWATVTVSANLVAGSNKVRLAAIGYSGPNIDHLKWSDATTTATRAVMGILSEQLQPQTSLRLLVAPNPAAASVELRLQKSAMQPTTITVVAATGTIVKRFSLNPHMQKFYFSVADLPAGLYVVLAKQGAETTSTKFVVERK